MFNTSSTISIYFDHYFVLTKIEAPKYWETKEYLLLIALLTRS